MESRPARNSLLISSGGTPTEDEPLALRVALAPVVGVSLELQSPARLEAGDAEGAGPDASLAPALPERAGSLGHDAVPGNDTRAGKKETGFSRSMVNSVGETMWKPSQLCASPSMNALRPADGREERPAVALGVLEEPLEGEANVARREGPAVVEADAGPQAEPEPREAVLGLDLRREPRHDARALDVARERLEDVRDDLPPAPSSATEAPDRCSERRPRSAR